MISLLIAVFVVWALIQIFSEPVKVEVRVVLQAPAAKRDHVGEYLERKRRIAEGGLL